MLAERTAIHLCQLWDREGVVAGARFVWGLGLLSASNLTENDLDRVGHNFRVGRDRDVPLPYGDC